MDKVTILQTSDLHGYLSNHDFINKKNWGLYSLTGHINKYDKKERLLLDSGDFLQGSPLTHFAFENKQDEHPIISLFNAIGYDGLTIGNHEFNYGLEFLASSLSKFKGDILSSNIKGLDSILNIKPYKVYEKKGLKIGVIGLTTSYIPNWEQKENIKGLKFLNPVEVYGKYEEELKEKSDIIVVNYHGGFECDLENVDQATESLTRENQASELLKKYDSIDVVLSGHQHRQIATKINNTFVVQPANNGQYISKVEIDVASKCVVDVSLLEADQDTTDVSLKIITSKIEEETEVYLDEVIGYAKEDMIVEDVVVARREGHSLLNLINKVQCEASGAMISVASLFDTAVGFKKEITMRDIIANYPYPNTFVVLEMTGKQLLSAMEVSASYYEVENGEIVINKRFTTPKAQHYQYDIFYGLDYEIDASKKENKVMAKIDGKALDLNQKYTVVVNNYRASNVSWYPMYKEAKVIKEIDKNMVDLLIDYLKKNKIIEIDDYKNYKVKK